MNADIFWQITIISFLIEAFIKTPELVWDDIQKKVIVKPVLGFAIGAYFSYASGLNFFAFVGMPSVLSGNALLVASAVLWGLALMRGSGFMNSLVEKVNPA